MVVNIEVGFNLSDLPKFTTAWRRWGNGCFHHALQQIIKIIFIFLWIKFLLFKKHSLAGNTTVIAIFRNYPTYDSDHQCNQSLKMQ
jgi:hypothetical protein